MLAEFLFILFIALIIAVLLAPVGGFRTRDEQASAGAVMLFFFLLLFPMIWAASAWTVPYGPQTYGINWIPILMFAILIGLFIAAVSPRNSPDRRPPVKREAEAREEVAVATVGLFGVGLLLFVVLALTAAITVYFI